MEVNQQYKKQVKAMLDKGADGEERVARQLYRKSIQNTPCSGGGGVARGGKVLGRREGNA